MNCFFCAFSYKTHHKAVGPSVAWPGAISGGWLDSQGVVGMCACVSSLRLNGVRGGDTNLGGNRHATFQGLFLAYPCVDWVNAVLLADSASGGFKYLWLPEPVVGGL